MGRTRRLATTYHSLWTLMDAGIPIIRALNLAAQGTRGPIKKALAGVSKSISSGQNLTESLKGYPRTFGKMDVMVLQAGENSGELGKSFKMLAEWYDFRGKITRTITSGFFLPMIVLHVGAAVAPIPAAVLGTDGLTGYLTGVVSILAWFYLPALIVIAASLAGHRIAALKKTVDGIILWIPVLGQAVREMSILRYCKAFNMLYKGGVPITQCTAQAHAVTGNTVIADLFKGATQCARDGRPASAGLSARLPIEYRNLWEIGEESGELDKTIDKIAQMAWDKAEFYFTQFAQWLPRLVYLFVCIMLVVQILKLMGPIRAAYSGLELEP